VRVKSRPDVEMLEKVIKQVRVGKMVGSDEEILVLRE